MYIVISVVAVLLATSAWAQSATVAVFGATATDPNLDPPLVETAHLPVCGQTPKVVEVSPITNPTGGFYDDPEDETKDCRVDLVDQMASLAPGTGYRAAVKLGADVYGPFSTAFAITAAQAAHPCDSTPASPASVTVNQTFLLGWCHLGANVTGWRIYRNGVLQTATIVTEGTAVSAGGDRYYTVQRQEGAVATNVVFGVAGLNDTVEGNLTAFPALAVVQPLPQAPVPATQPRVTIQ